MAGIRTQQGFCPVYKVEKPVTRHKVQVSDLEMCTFLLSAFFNHRNDIDF